MISVFRVAVWQRFNNRANIGFYVILRMSDYNRLKLNVSRLPEQGMKGGMPAELRGGISLSYPRRNKIRKLAE